MYEKINQRLLRDEKVLAVPAANTEKTIFNISSDCALRSIKNLRGLFDGKESSLMIHDNPLFLGLVKIHPRLWEWRLGELMIAKRIPGPRTKRTSKIIINHPSLCGFLIEFSGCYKILNIGRIEALASWNSDEWELPLAAIFIDCLERDGQELGDLLTSKKICHSGFAPVCSRRNS